MGLVTLAFLLAFTSIYLSKSLEKKPEFVTTVVEKITANLDKVALWGAIYGLVAAILSLVVASGGGMLLRLVANLLIVVMALPFAFDQILSKLQGKVPASIVEEVKKAIGLISKQEKYVGYAGAAFSLILFADVFLKA